MNSFGCRVVLIALCFTLIALRVSEAAQHGSLAERGRYLVDSILACGNCHTPKSATGEAINDKVLSGGGAAFTTPAFDATSSNITPDRETGIGAWTNAEIRSALIAGVRPNHGRLANAPLAAVMPDCSRSVLAQAGISPAASRHAVPEPR